MHISLLVCRNYWSEIVSGITILVTFYHSDIIFGLNIDFQGVSFLSYIVHIWHI